MINPASSANAEHNPIRTKIIFMSLIYKELIAVA
jgi:hypothetical protein